MAHSVAGIPARNWRSLVLCCVLAGERSKIKQILTGNKQAC